jgi:hypothetical protein
MDILSVHAATVSRRLKQGEQLNVWLLAPTPVAASGLALRSLHASESSTLKLLCNVGRVVVSHPADEINNPP